MSFLSPLYLLLAGAAAVPLLIHLMRRRIGTRVELPSVRYLARAEQEHSRKLRLRNLLLMLLRVLAVLAIAAAAARPVGRIAGAGHAPTALAIVLDNSLSSSAIVGGAPVLDRLKAAAAAAARAASSSDRLWLVTADGRVSGGTPAAVAAAAERVEALAGAGDPAAALLRAASLARGAGLAEREVALLTDAQATTWPRPVQLGDAHAALFAPDLPAPKNHAVVGVEVRPPRWTPRGAIVGRLLVSGDSAAYRVALGGGTTGPRTLARGTVSAAGGSSGAEFTVQAAPPERGWVSGAMELEPDELRGDDARYFALWIGPAPALLVDAGTGPFVRTATDALVESSRARAAGDAAAPGTVAVVSADALTRLPALIVAPSDPVRVGAANRALERAGVTWRFGAQRRGESVVRAAAGVTPLDGVTASLRYALVAAPGGGAAATTDTLASAAGAEPWIVAGRGYVIVASPLAPEATSLPVRAAFVPLLAELATQRLGGAAGPVLSAAPGATIALPTGVDAMQADAVGAPRLPVAAGAISAPTRPGVYFLLRGAERVGAVVVNAEPEESALARLTAGELAARIGAHDVRVAGARGEPAWPAAVFASSTRRPLVTPLLLAALALLVAETALTRAGAVGRRPAGAGSTRGRPAGASRADAA